jgi:hypothetical protein
MNSDRCIAAGLRKLRLSVLMPRKSTDGLIGWRLCMHDVAATRSLPYAPGHSIAILAHTGDLSPRNRRVRGPMGGRDLAIIILIAGRRDLHLF